MMEKLRSQFNMMLQQTTMMIAQIQTTSNYQNNTRSNRNNKNDSNVSASIKSASASNANHATNTESNKANKYKSTTFENTTTNAELMTQPDQDKENSYHTLVSTGTSTRPMPKKYRNPTKSNPTAKRVLAADADQHLRDNHYSTSPSILAHPRPDPLTTNELVNELRPLSRLRPLRP